MFYSFFFNLDDYQSNSFEKKHLKVFKTKIKNENDENNHEKLSKSRKIIMKSRINPISNDM